MIGVPGYVIEEVNIWTCPHAAYIHIPFCLSKCYYCEFNSYPGLERIFDDYINALIIEIERAKQPNAEPLDTVYFGGGTPTILLASNIAAILSAIEKNIGINSDAEVTIEANPGTIDSVKLSELRRSGFNRLSMGVQSFNDDLLIRIGRAHTVRDAFDAYAAARQAGFTNVSIDLIFALPGQDLRDWNRTLKSAINLNPEHISLYELSIEEGTHFAELCAEGRLDLPDEEMQIEMYELAIQKLASAGFEHYEVSNFARPGFRSRHNQVYWRNESYYGFGAGATSYVNGIRARRTADPQAYINAIDAGLDAVEFSEKLDERSRLGETIIQGLRMLDGIDLYELQQRTSVDVLAEFGEKIKSLEKRGFLEIAGGNIKVTHRGLLLLNDVSQEFLIDNFSG